MSTRNLSIYIYSAVLHKRRVRGCLITMTCMMLFRTSYKPPTIGAWPTLFLLNVFTAVLSVVTAAGVVPCGSPKKRPRISSIVYFTFAPLRSVEIF